MSTHPKPIERHPPYYSPLALLEEMFFQLDWEYAYTTDSELTSTIPGRWCSYHLIGTWREDLESLMITALIDMKISPQKREGVDGLLSLHNPRIWLGHFEVTSEGEMVAFRYVLTLRGGHSATLEQVEDIIMAAATECDRLYPALQFTLWGGKTPEEALLAAMMDTCGEA